MSKDDACKVTSAGKHKERKPKKPHYIPRPWGKPYNYKCFQCPFTCMEKSHLYNHMKYSLCKNSLSLLIESDWPYKKGNVLHPDQLRPFQQGHALHAKDEAERPTARPEERPARRRGGGGVEDEGEDREGPGLEDEEEAAGRGEGAEALLKDTGGGGDLAEPKKAKPPEPELLMADVLSLEDQLLRARSVEVEAQLKHYKLSKTYLAAPGLLSEQWRLLAASGHAKAKGDGSQPRAGGSIPCYPPPPGLVDYQDLSVLGVGYPLGPGLFSYVNSLPSAATGLAAQAAHAQLAQLPFLASAAQLMHPSTGAHADRALLPPRLYYPFLCEHAFGQADTAKPLHKASANAPEPGSLTGFQPKVNLWKVPALRPGNAAVSPAGWASPQRESPDLAFRPGEKTSAAKDGKTSWSLKRTGAPMAANEAPVGKKPAVGFTLDFLKTASALNVASDTLLYHSSLQDSHHQTRPSDLWYDDVLTGHSSDAASLSGSMGSNGRDPGVGRVDGASESVAALLADLSKALQEYQEAERKISHLEKEDTPARRLLWEHLSKIRGELSHIHQALERSARNSDGPLDLSVKRCPTDADGEQDAGARGDATETEEDDEEPDDRKEDEDDESERRSMRASLESRKQSLDMLIKMSQAASAGAGSGAMVGAEVLGMRPSPAEALWPGRTTKCEADSSVLLCPDGRSVVFADIAPPTAAAAKTPKRPASIQRLEAQGPPSPLTVTD